MSAGRVYSLLTSTGDGDADNFKARDDSLQILFPSLTFTCSGKILKWILTGRYRVFNDESPEISLWRMFGNSSSVYKKVNNTTTALLPLSGDREDGVYEFIPTTPVIAQAGDIVGLYIPEDSVFRPNYNEDDEDDDDDDGETLYYWNRDKENQDDYFDIKESRTRRGSPLITVEICKSHYHCNIITKGKGLFYSCVVISVQFHFLNANYCSYVIANRKGIHTPKQTATLNTM